MGDQALQQCYNKGCGKKFNPGANNSQACQYHPGPPYFHDAYKIWNCCNRKSTDFTEWLSIPGCTRGPHNPEKPPDLEKPKREETPVDGGGEAEVHVTHSKPARAAPRASTEAFAALKRTVAPQVFENIKKRSKPTDLEESVNDGYVNYGTSCKNAACNATYNGAASNSEECWYHSGHPVFHEGLKYWSCCTKTTTDFETFLSQEGCTVGKHEWFKKEGVQETQKCRFDWHQTATLVVITIYSKGTLPDASDVSANSVSLKGALQYNFGDNIFPLDFNLWGSIDVSQSSVSITPSKVEVQLRKLTPTKWARLEFDPDRDADTGDC